jgi:hypothetical protein
MAADPWRDFLVAQTSRTGDGDFAKRFPQNYFADLCANSWRDFGQQPGKRLRWGQAGKQGYELRTAKQQTIASVLDGRPPTVSAGGRTFTFKLPSSGTPSFPVIAELAARGCRDRAGHFAADTLSSWLRFLVRETEQSNAIMTAVGQAGNRIARYMISQAQRSEAREVGELVDETGMPVVYISGKNFDLRATACITFPDHRWLRFLVRGTHVKNAIMTAVDQAGNRIARYKISNEGFAPRSGSVEITVHPDRELTDELMLMVAISAPWLRRYFERQPRGG